MDFSRYTNKAQAAILKAQSIAGEYQHSAIEPVHIFLGLMEQDEGLVPRIIQKIGAHPATLQTELRSELDRLPRTSQPAAAGIGLSRASLAVFTQAEKEAKQMRDEYTSTEHLLLALGKDTSMAVILSQHGVQADDILRALKSIRRAPAHHQPGPGIDL